MADVAETIAVVLGLPGLEVMPFDQDQLDEAGLRWVRHNETHDGTWKLPWVHQRVQGRAAVWIDDDLRPDAHDWAAHRSEATLILEPSSNVGLTEEHWVALERFTA